MTSGKCSNQLTFRTDAELPALRQRQPRNKFSPKQVLRQTCRWWDLMIHQFQIKVFKKDVLKECPSKFIKEPKSDLNSA